MKINKKIVAERYDNYGEAFEDRCLKLGGDFDKRVLEYLGEHVRPGTHLLNVAGGDGWATSLLDPKKVAIVSTDISRGLLEVARKRRPNVLVGLVHDFDTAFPFLDAEYDYVVCTGALEFCENLHFTLGEMMRVLKPDGLMLFTIDKLDPTSEVQKDEFFVYDVRGFFSRRHSIEEVREVIKNIGGVLERHGTHPAFRLNDSWVTYDYYLVRRCAPTP